MPGGALRLARHRGNARMVAKGGVGEEEEDDEEEKEGRKQGSPESCVAKADNPWPEEMTNDLRGRSSMEDLSPDGTLFEEGCVQLERRWALWHGFMKEHSSLDDWLRLAMQVAASPNSSHVLFVTAKEELQKFEGLQAEARQRLAQLDGLTQAARVLVGLFKGTMRGRLLTMTQDCGRRWDRLHTTVESICRRLRHFVSLREDFEMQRDEMAVWLADMDLRLTEVEHFSGRDTCTKMRQLQTFQQAVGENAGRLQRLLERGEELIQRSEPADAQAIEAQLQDLLLYCARVFEGVGHLHTRLLSMRLVFEEDWTLCSPLDSGCPSENVFEDDCGLEHGLGRHPLDHLVLEWDPSVDVGGSVSPDDTDSSYYSAANGVYLPEEALTKEPLMRRGALLSSPCSQPDITSAAAAAAACDTGSESRSEDVAPPCNLNTGVGADRKTSTPVGRQPETMTFDPDRISAWLGQAQQQQQQQGDPQRTPWTRAAQTELSAQRLGLPEDADQHVGNVSSQRCPHPQSSTQTHTASTPPPSWNSQPCSDWRIPGRHSDPQNLENGSGYAGSSRDHIHVVQHRAPAGQEASCTCWWSRGSWQLGPQCLATGPWASVLLYTLMALLLALILWPWTGLSETACHRMNTMASSFHLSLRYINGPPPT